MINFIIIYVKKNNFKQVITCYKRKFVLKMFSVVFILFSLVLGSDWDSVETFYMGRRFFGGFGKT